MRFFVNQYEVDRCFGGPEEGGWYYDRGEFLSCLAGPFKLEDDAFLKCVLTTNSQPMSL